MRDRPSVPGAEALARRETDVLAAVTRVLELDAGFAELTLAARHRELGLAVDRALDLDSGAQAAFRPSKLPELAVGMPLKRSIRLRLPGRKSKYRFTFTALEKIARMVTAANPREQLELRQNPDLYVVIASLKLLLCLRQLRLTAADVISQADRDEACERQRGYSLPALVAQAAALAEELAEEVSRIRARIEPRWAGHADYAVGLLSGVIEDLAVDVHDASAAAGHLVYVLDSARDRELFSTLGLVLARSLQAPGVLRLSISPGEGTRRNTNVSVTEGLELDLVELRRCCDDFTDADLSREDLNAFDLEGIRWSRAATVWPSEWRGMIEDDSVEVEPGILEVRRGRSHVLFGAFVR